MRLLTEHGPDSPVAWARGRVTTAGDLVAHVAGFAELLPVAEDDAEIVVICRDRYRFTVALLAAWQRGYAVALPPNPQPDTVRALRLRPGVQTVVHDVDGIDKGIDVRDAAVVTAAREKLGRMPYAALGPFPEDRRLATVYTSGSTGHHVACPKTAGQLLGEARVLVDAFRLQGSRVLPMVPAHHIYGLLFGVLAPLTGGGSFFRFSPLHATEVGAVLEGGAEVLVSVPAQLRGLCVAEEGELPAVPRVFSSGAPLSPRVAAQVKARFGWTVTEVFGSSETGGIGWRDSGGEGPWTPLPGVTVGALADGRMALTSPFLHPDAPRPFEAADRIEAHADGTFAHLGRADGVLKIGGVRVSLAEIERRLLAIDGVRDAGVLAREVGGARGHEVWVAVVAPELTARAIRASLRGWLAPVAMPRRLLQVDALPRTEAGKLPRAALEALFDRGTG
ncbi:MAG: class I adenylate-forming enzyme family protein [Myxococcota bacterium]|nr:class I adenylate-forming enzyme family protein [Myxococcota bacterium]